MYKKRYVDNNGIEIAIAEQRYGESIEGWFKKDDNEWIRLDFFLEFFLTKDVAITKKFKGQLNSIEKAEQYYELLFSKFKELTDDANNFDFEKYSKWIRSKSDTEEARLLISSE